MFAQSIWTISLTVPASPWFTSFTYCRNQSIVILWLTLRLSNQCLSIKLRKSSLVSSTSLCTENTNFIQALESVKNVIMDRHSRPCVSCSNSTLLILKHWIMMHWQARCLLLRLTNSKPDGVESTIVSSLLITSVSSSSVSTSRILNTNLTSNT